MQSATILAVTIALVITSYELVQAEGTEAGANVQARAFAESKATVAASAEATSYGAHLSHGEEEFKEREIERLTSAQPSALDLLVRAVNYAVNERPYLFNQVDYEAFLKDPGFFLEYRGSNWRRAAHLAIKMMRWRAKMGLNNLDASDFPCDLFRLGLIFEYGRSHGRSATGEYVDKNPVIWIRLGALGNVVKEFEKITAKRTVSFAYNTVRSVVRKSMDVAHRIATARPRTRSSGQPIIDNLSVKNEATIAHVLKSIAWWIDNWKNTHNSQATLVLDFENTDYAFNSWTVGEFFIGLDDHFPGLFDQIIGFRYKPRRLSLHAPISMFNRIFSSRIVSSPETDAKLKFVRSEPMIGAYIPRVDIHGYTMLPEYISGHCHSPTYEPPAGCRDSPDPGHDSLLYDPKTWEAIRNSFYSICKPKVRGV